MMTLVEAYHSLLVRLDIMYARQENRKNILPRDRQRSIKHINSLTNNELLESLCQPFSEATIVGAGEIQQTPKEQL